MSEQLMSTVPTQRVVDHAFTEPNPFLSETHHLPTPAGALPGQRTLNEVPAQREHQPH